MRVNSFGDCAAERGGARRGVPHRAFELDAPEEAVALQRTIERFPFVPSDPRRLREHCYEAYNIQVAGAGAARLDAAEIERAVIGVSGGLDSTQALIVAARAMDALGFSRKNVLGLYSARFRNIRRRRKPTLGRLWALSASPVRRSTSARRHGRCWPTSAIHLRAAKPSTTSRSRTFRPGLRTDYLFRLANHHGGLVVGTGDLSELALGWCTYGVGDQMSHYNVNASVAKTLVQHLIRFVAGSGEVDAETSRVLHAILATEISPELVPTPTGETIQSSEKAIGPYALQDFNLYYLTRYGFRPSKIAFLAHHAWSKLDRGEWPKDIPAAQRKAYSLAEIRHWLALFLKRFFANQFKRSALPNGPKISSGGSLSPRGDWRAPSDAHPDVWLAELDNVPET